MPHAGIAATRGEIDLYYTTDSVAVSLTIPRRVPLDGQRRELGNRGSTAPVDGFEVAGALQEAAAVRGLALDTKRLVAGASLAQAFAAAPIEGLDSLTFDQVSRGTTIGAAYVGLPHFMGIPQGFYTLRLADAVCTQCSGESPPFTLSLLDANGGAVGQFAASVQPGTGTARPTTLGIGLQGDGLVLTFSAPGFTGGANLGTDIPVLGFAPAGPPLPVHLCSSIVALPPPPFCASTNGLTGGFEIAQEIADAPVQIASGSAVFDSLLWTLSKALQATGAALPSTVTTASGLRFDLGASTLGRDSVRWLNPFVSPQKATFHLATASDICVGPSPSSSTARLPTTQNPPMVLSLPFQNAMLGSTPVSGVLQIVVSLALAPGACTGGCCSPAGQTDPNRVSIELDFSNSAIYGPVVVIRDVHGVPDELSGSADGDLLADDISATSVEQAYTQALEGQLGRVNFFGQCWSLKSDGGGRMTDLLALQAGAATTAVQFADLAVVGVPAEVYDGTESAVGPAGSVVPGTPGTIGSPPVLALLGTILQSDVPADCPTAKLTSETGSLFTDQSSTDQNVIEDQGLGALTISASTDLPGALIATDSLLVCPALYNLLGPGNAFPYPNLASVPDGALSQYQRVLGYLPPGCGCAGTVFATTVPCQPVPALYGAGTSSLATTCGTDLGAAVPPTLDDFDVAVYSPKLVVLHGSGSDATTGGAPFLLPIDFAGLTGLGHFTAATTSKCVLDHIGFLVNLLPTVDPLHATFSTLSEVLAIPSGDCGFTDTHDWQIDATCLAGTAFANPLPPLQLPPLPQVPFGLVPLATDPSPEGLSIDYGFGNLFGP